MVLLRFIQNRFASGKALERRASRPRFLRGISVAIAIIAIIGNIASAQMTPIVCEQDVWEISTRHIPSSRCYFTSPPFEVHRWTTCRWERRALEEVIGMPADSQRVPLTIIYVHGNWMERENARERVRIINCYLAKQACEPYRLLMYSWPSERDHRIIRDLRDNAQRADAEAYYLGWLLQSVAATSDRVSLMGFSYGARTVAGALHLDSGGSLPGIPCLPTVAEHPQYRVSLIAPAVEQGSLQANGRHGKSMDHVELMVNLYNSRDPILRRFRFVDSFARPIAAGFTGFEAIANPRSTEPLISRERLQQYDCGSQIGSTHRELDYYGECPYFKKAINNLLWKSP